MSINCNRQTDFHNTCGGGIDGDIHFNRFCKVIHFVLIFVESVLVCMYCTITLFAHVTYIWSYVGYLLIYFTYTTLYIALPN